MHLAIAVSYRVLGVSAHTAGAHLMGGEHHDAIDAHTVSFQLPVKLAELLLADYAILWPFHACAFVVQRVDSFGSRCKMDTGRLS